MIIKTINNESVIEINLRVILLFIRSYRGKVTYAKRTLLNMIVIIGLIRLYNRTNANINIINGTILS